MSLSGTQRHTISTTGAYVHHHISYVLLSDMQGALPISEMPNWRRHGE
jgi:hypothetical protein